MGALASLTAILIAAVMSIVVTHDDEEAKGWMYKEVSLVPKACPRLAPFVKTIAAQPKMSVADAKRIAGMLRAAAIESNTASSRYEGRIAMGMPVGRKPEICSKYDPNYEEAYGIELLAPYKFSIPEKEQGS